VGWTSAESGEMKSKVNVPDKRPLADYLLAVAITAKALANQITSHKLKESIISGESPIASEHESSNRRVRRALTDSGIFPEKLSAAEDINKIKSRLKSGDKKLPK